jgi:YspA, cpYpsA-related SLOG family
MSDAARVIVFGSRRYADRHHLYRVLDGIFRRYGPLVIVHGAAPGADSLADQWARLRAGQGWPVSRDPHPADWHGPCEPRCGPPPFHRRRRWDGSDYCPAKGVYRNMEMADLPAAGYAAFPLRGTLDPKSGTGQMLAYVRKKGIPELYLAS